MEGKKLAWYPCHALIDLTDYGSRRTGRHVTFNFSDGDTDKRDNDDDNEEQEEQHCGNK